MLKVFLKGNKVWCSYFCCDKRLLGQYKFTGKPFHTSGPDLKEIHNYLPSLGLDGGGSPQKKKGFVEGCQVCKIYWNWWGGKIRRFCV